MSHFEVCISIRDFLDFLNIKDRFLEIYGHGEHTNLKIIKFLSNIFAELENRHIRQTLLLYPYIFKSSGCVNGFQNENIYNIYYLPSNSETKRDVIISGMIITKYRMKYEENDAYKRNMEHSAYGESNKMVKLRFNKNNKIVEVKSHIFNANKNILRGIYYNIIPYDRQHLFIECRGLMYNKHIPIFNIYPLVFNKLNNILNILFLIIVISMNRRRYKNRVNLPPELIEYIRMEFCTLPRDIYDK